MGRGTAEQAERYPPEITWHDQETLLNQQTGPINLLRERLTRPDNSPVVITTLLVDSNSKQSLLIDPRFLKRPIITEPSRLLINQEATMKVWGSQAGLKPEEFLADENIPLNSIGIPVTNAGWQKGAFWIRKGKLISLLDDNTLIGEYEILAGREGAWDALQINLENGHSTQNLDCVEIGFNVPLIVKDGQIVSQLSIWERGDPRALADSRNWVDMAAEKNTTPDFWRLVRKFMPITPASARRVTREDRFAVIRVDDIDPQDVDAFQEAIKDAGLENHWRIIVREKDPKVVRAVVCAVLPSNKIPAVGIGHDKDGNLMLTVVDGRQKDSTGATIDELAQIMLEKGATNAGLGAAGGDALILAKQKNGISILNSPSNIDPQTGRRISRAVPSLLVIN